MTESPEGQAPPDSEEEKFGGGKGPAEADSPGDPDPEMGVGGYEGRDPKTDMPRIPAVPETQDDPKSHDAAPDPKAPEPPASHGGDAPGSG